MNLDKTGEASDPLFHLTVLILQTPKLNVLVHPSTTSSPATAGSCFPWKRSDKPTVHSLPGTKQQAERVREQLVNIVNDSVPKEPDISFKKTDTKAELKDRILDSFIQWRQTRFQINAYVAMHLVDV